MIKEKSERGLIWWGKGARAGERWEGQKKHPWKEIDHVAGVHDRQINWPR